MNYFMYIVLFFACVANPLGATFIEQEEIQEMCSNKGPVIDPTDDEILQYDQAISDQVEGQKISSSLAFFQNIGIEILLGYLAIKRNVYYYYNLLKQNLWRVGNSIVKLKG